MNSAETTKYLPDNALLDVKAIVADPLAGSLVAEILAEQLQGGDTGAFASKVLAIVAKACETDFVAILISEFGRMRTWAELGPRQLPPNDLVAEALDRDSFVRRGDWAALAPRRAEGKVLVLHWAARRSLHNESRLAALCDAACAALVAGLHSVHQRQHDRDRLKRLEAILTITGQWAQTNAMEPLLFSMAEAATKLLGADRASIFLWDEANRTLVGRPALGVASNELRIADTAGIVGQVIQTGEPRRVGAGGDQSVIDREVDAKLNYQTRSLLCVPLRGGQGKLFGAFEVINKLSGDFTADDQDALIELASHAAVALENTQQLEELVRSRRHLVDQAAQGAQLIGASPAIEALRSTIRRVANTELAILILGENGAGKEVVSQSIHYLSPRRNHPFIAVNCAAITETLLESELFGHEKGAFTDAHEARQGKFELASGGTLFLDEIGDLSLSGQAKLLRVLEEKIVVRVGGSKPIHADARVIAATNQNLSAMVREKKFRQDLFFRLNVVTLELPPLRDRGEDILLLADHFLADFCRKAHRKPLRFSAAARKRLLEHSWPGNIRELRNLMERLAYLLAGDRIEAEDLAFILAPSANDGPSLMSFDLPLSEATDKFQMEFIRKAAERCKGNMSEAAKRLGLHRSNLYRKMRQLGMPGGE